MSSQQLYTGAPYNAVGEKLGRALKARQGLETRLAYRQVGCSWLAELEELYVESDSEHSLIPRPSTPPVFDCLQNTKTEGEGLGILSCDLQHGHHMSSQLFSTAKLHVCTGPIWHSEYYASDEDGKSTSRELHRAYEMYPGYNHDSKRLLNGKRENTQR